MKKGVALETAVKFIVGIVFLVLIIFVLMQTGLLAAFKEQTAVMFCTFSAYTRDYFIKTIWSLLSIALTMITIFTVLIGGAGALFQTGIRGITKVPKIILKDVAKGTLTRAFSYLGIGSTIMLFVILTMFPKIPLMCPSLTIDVGFRSKPVDSDKFIETIASRTIDCYNMLGAGELNPLFGIDPPNPRICFTLETYIKTEDNMKHVFDETYRLFNASWPLGKEPDLKLYLYCGSTFKGNNPDDWADCKVKDSRVYVMFLDRHDFDWTGSLSSAPCGGISVGPFGQFDPPHDAIVWCVEEI